ncbi:hypothetical protein F5141DRAFT_1067146 [Pisolithus sp. B1]|nr:hypothetical protein F5141DRAFT_1067146 [Pisolithus sp. B1]
MSLSSVPNALDDATHAALDKHINQVVRSVVDEERAFEDYGRMAYMFLLQTIVEFSNGTLDPKYLGLRVAGEAIMTLPELVAMLDVAWKSRSYRDIRNLGHFKIASYDRKAVDGFYEYLKSSSKTFAPVSDGGPLKYYAKFCSVVQSSGTGKSRLLYEAFHFGTMSPEDVLGKWNDSMFSWRSEDRKPFFLARKVPRWLIRLKPPAVTPPSNATSLYLRLPSGHGGTWSRYILARQAVREVVESGRRTLPSDPLPWELTSIDNFPFFSRFKQLPLTLQTIAWEEFPLNSGKLMENLEKQVIVTGSDKDALASGHADQERMGI